LANSKVTDYFLATPSRVMEAK